MIAMTVASLVILLRALKLPTMARHADEVAQLAEREGWTFVRYLHHLVELEVHERRRRRIARNLKDSELPPDKTLATLNRARLPAKVAKVLPTLCEGAFIERGDNLLAFGLPGRGKTHLVCAIGHELIQRGYRVLFTPTYALVQRLLAAKRDLRLEQELAVLDRFDAVLLDDIGYVQQNRDEMEVLFMFLAERYERRTVMIVTEARVTYRQDWPAYTRAQCEEKERVQLLLRGLCDGITQPPQTNGRPRLPLADVITASTTSSTTTTTPLPGAAPTAPGPTTSTTAHPSTKEDPTTNLKKTKNRIQRTEADGEM